MAAGAQLVLDETTLQMLCKHITTFSDEELATALEAMASQQSKTPFKTQESLMLSRFISSVLVKA